jgi:hypothetical protein
LKTKYIFKPKNIAKSAELLYALVNFISVWPNRRQLELCIFCIQFVSILKHIKKTKPYERMKLEKA